MQRMAGKYSVEFCREMVAASKAALLKALEAQSYSIGGRSKTNANVESCQKTLDLWSSRLEAAENGLLTSGKPRCRSIIVHG